jgi:pimeloyl-ACP methyl ester carboxylesterase
MDRRPVISAFVLFLVGILSAGPASQAAAAQGATLAAASPVATSDFSGLVDIGGRKLYLECRGQGNPTVILEAGAYARADVWSRDNQRQAGVRTRDKVADLHALLRAADIRGPYVLVAHSSGGLVVRLYASTYPDEVVGMVLLDSTHEDVWLRFQEALTPVQWAEFEALSQTRRYWTRTRKRSGGIPPRWRMTPPPVRYASRERRRRCARCRSSFWPTASHLPRRLRAGQATRWKGS